MPTSIAWDADVRCDPEEGARGVEGACAPLEQQACRVSRCRPLPLPLRLRRRLCSRSLRLCSRDLCLYNRGLRL
eukprot:169842-Rhodomonas_salina.1